MDTQASKQVEWCLRKAEKELKESLEQKKKARHRGLVKIEPNKTVAIQHIDKAKHFLKAFQLLSKNNFQDLAVGAGFYSLYHCFLAISSKFGYESKNQTCTISLIQYMQEQGKISIKDEIIEFMRYEEDQKNYENSVIELRENYTYGVDLTVKNEELDKIEKLCLEFIETTKNIVYK